MIKKYVCGVDDLAEVFSRSQMDDPKVKEVVSEIISDIRRNKDAALFGYCRRFDGYDPEYEGLEVSEEEFEAAYEAVSDDLLAALRRAADNVRDYHKRQLKQFEKVIYESDGKKLGWQYRPLQRAALYIPGGKAAYPSSILMCALPAKVAGVEEIYLATPNPKNPLTLVAAKECGVDKVFKMGGAQAIAALAFGTQSVPKVDIIAGPGNVYVTMAKKEVYGNVAIDMIAGPSEILVIADETADAASVAADMLSQAEHDELAASILVTDSNKLADEVALEIEKQSAMLSRREIISKSVENNGAIIVVNNLDDAILISDKVAPEHLEICTKNAEDIAAKVKNAGAIFVGHNSPEPLGDYFAGPSHCLPTSGTAKYFSVLSVDTFMKKISYINYSQEALKNAAKDIAMIADCEGLTAHANTVRIRFDKDKI